MLAHPVGQRPSSGQRPGVADGFLGRPQSGRGLGVEHRQCRWWLRRAAADLLDGYEHIASNCLTTSFILSQRESATRHLKRLPDTKLRHEVLADLASGAAFATVGLSQLTTSRQHRQPALTARRRGDAYLFNGTIPWVTGASQARHIVIGAVTEDNSQILVALPTALPGVHIETPLDLMALRGSLTAEIRLDNVEIDKRWLLAGPAERVLATGKGGAGGLETSCLALGLARAAIDYVVLEARVRPDLQQSADNLERNRVALRQELHRLAQEGAAPDTAAALRGGKQPRRARLPGGPDRQ